MLPRLDLLKTLRLIAVPLTLATAFWATDALAVQLETPEIVFTTVDAKPLADMATQLGNAVAIYEYAHNYFEFSAYHGSRSGSINTFMGQRGSDVDIATAIIAMIRSQNIPARYAVGTIRLPAAQLTNWLGVGNLDVAVQVLKDQGIQGVVLATDRSTVDLEHVWAEVSVPFAQYRGLTTSGSVDCSLPANASSCNWIPLDGSFKQKTYNGLNIDPYNALSFDYTGYYRAIVDSATDPFKRQDKNPLTILEEQIATWLRTSNPGKTLEDVADIGQINQIHDGLLPASLPYTVTGTIRHYDSVALHDAVVPASEPKKWDKTVTVTQNMCAPGGANISMGSATLSLVEVATRRLTSVLESNADASIVQQVWRSDGVQIGGGFLNVSGGGGLITFTCPDGSIKSPKIGMPYWISVEMDGAPGATSVDLDRKITASYPAIIGGYYLVATGGESSNWSQVHRAADQLLANNVKDTIVFKPADNNVINPATGLACDLSTGLNCTPYVDINGTGVYAANDPALLQNKPALDDLTGGLLYVAASQYFANLHDQFERADHLMKTKTPIIGFLGVVSSTYEAEYIGGTAFSILPGGLLIDMKGITISGSYRINDVPVTYSNSQFEFLGHITSSLEHETWQELTGYDAVSTVRGIQMAMASGTTTTLLNPKKNSTVDTLPGLYPSFGFSTTVPAGFTYTPFTIFATTPATWTHAISGSSFDTFLSTVTTTTNATQRLIGTYTYGPTSGLYGWSNCVANQVTSVNAYAATVSLTGSTCYGTPFSGVKSVVLGIISSDWTTNIIPKVFGQTTLNYFDTKQGFTTTGRVFRAAPNSVTQYSALTIGSIRNDLYSRDLTQNWVEYLMPSTLVTGPNNHFEVDIRKAYSTPTGRLSSLSFEILNRGY
jgi:hypothetical protein